MTWEHAEGMTDAEVEALLFRDGGRNEAATRAAIDYAHVHDELHRQRRDAAAAVVGVPGGRSGPRRRRRSRTSTANSASCMALGACD